MRFQQKKIALALAHVMAGGAFSALVVAPVAAQAPAAGQQPIRVEVTGTNIRRTDTETPSEVQVITREQMIEQGFTSISEVLRNLTQNSNGTLSTGFARAFASGASGVSLRGLGVGATLVLIDGQRAAGWPRSDDAQRQFVDLGSIPFVAIERVEVLLDGASAIYGSDAMAGVVNVILKKDFKGTYAMATGGTTTKGGGTTWDAQIMQGFGDVNAGLGGWIAAEYRSQEAIYLNQRQGEPWNTTDYRGWGGDIVNPGARNPNVPNPVIRNAPYLAGPGGALAWLTPNCDTARRNANECQYADDWSRIQPRSQNVSVIGNLTGKLPGDWLLSLTGSLFNQDSGQTTAPRTVPFGSFGGFTTGGPNQAPAVGVNPIPVFNVPASYPGNPFGVPANIRAYSPINGINQSMTQDTTTYRLAGQATGTAWGWDSAITAGYTHVRQNWTYNGYLAPAALKAALNDPVHPYLLTGGNTAAQDALVYPTLKNNIWNNLSYIQASGSRDLMKLDGGPLSLAIGAGDVYRNLQAPNPEAGQKGTVAIPSATTFSVGSQNNAYAYAEVAMPFTKTLEVDVALRYDYYNAPSNSTWNPKIGVKWTPMKELALRGTAGTGFRAPYITEAGNSGATYNLGNYRDVLNCPVLLPSGAPDLTSGQNVQGTCSFPPAFFQATDPNLKPERSQNYTAGFILEPIRGWETTFDYYYIKVKDQIVAAVNQPTFTMTPANTVRVADRQLVQFYDGHTGLSNAPAIAYVNAGFINSQQVTTSGFDLGTSYTWTLPDNSKLLTSVMWSHIINYDLTVDGVKYKLAGTHGPSAVSGDTGTPKDRAAATIQWTKGPLTSTATINYVGRFNVTDPSYTGTACEDGLIHQGSNFLRWTSGGPALFCDVASFTYVNLNFAYQYNKEWQFLLTVNNAFNAKAPVDMETYGSSAGQQPNAGNNGVPYNPALHQIGAVGPFWSLGFVYTFK